MVSGAWPSVEREPRSHGFKRCLRMRSMGRREERFVADESEAAGLRSEQHRKSYAWSSRNCRSRAGPMEA